MCNIQRLSESGMEIQNYSRQHINAKVCSSPTNMVWKFTGFYGQPDASKRMEAWNLLRFISRMEPSPWLCLGDFNEILSLNEKYGGSGHQRGLMENFQRTLDECGLSELGYRGSKFTRNNGKEGMEFIKERLDKMVTNKGWCEAFLDVEVVIGPAICSNHSPLSVFPLGQSKGQRRTRNFKYEASWELHNRCRQIIENSWKGSINDPWMRLNYNMEGCKMALTRWQRMEFGKPNRVFMEQCNKLASLQGEENDHDVGQALGVQRDL
jgi:hypothetical protein